MASLHDRIEGVLLGTAAGMRWAHRHEFGPPRGPELEVAMVGGGPWAPGNGPTTPPWPSPSLRPSRRVETPAMRPCRTPSSRGGSNGATMRKTLVSRHAQYSAVLRAEESLRSGPVPRRPGCISGPVDRG